MNEHRFDIGAKVTTPHCFSGGVVCQIDADGSIYVMWGDNNRRRYTIAEQQRIRPV